MAESPILTTSDFADALGDFFEGGYCGELWLAIRKGPLGKLQVLPTLSLGRKADGTMDSFSTTADICEHFGELGFELGAPDLSQTPFHTRLLHAVKSCSILDYDESVDNRIIVVFRSELADEAFKANLKSAMVAFRDFRDQSLNVWNLSNENRFKDWKNFRDDLLRSNAPNDCVRELAAFAQKTYGVQPIIFECKSTLDSKFEWQSDIGLQDKITLEKLQVAFPFLATRPSASVEREILRNPLLHTIDGRQVLWSPIYSREDPNFLRFAIVFVGNPNIPKFLPASIDYFSNQYFSNIIHLERSKLLAKLTEMTFKIGRFDPSFKIRSWEDIYDHFRNLLQPHLAGIASLCGAHSVVIRRWFPNPGRLEIFLEHCEEGSIVSPDDPLTTLKVEAGSRSVNVKVFLGPQDDHCYIPNLTAKSMGIRNRLRSKSEYCHQIYTGGGAWGTFNVESQFPRAFDETARSFLQSCTNLIRATLEGLLSSADRWSHIRGLVREDDLHELKNFIEECPGLKKMKERNELLTFLQAPKFDVKWGDTLDCVTRFINELIASYKSVEASRRKLLLKHCSVKLGPTKVDPTSLRLLLIVVGNLLSNSLRHGIFQGKSCDRISIADIPDSTVIEIRIKTRSVVPAAFVSQGGLVAMGGRSAHGPSRSGLLIAGTICRALGGSLFIYESGICHIISARIPYRIHGD